MSSDSFGVVIERLARTLESRANDDPNSSYTAKLLDAGPVKIAKKLGEEGVEAALATARGTEAELTAEAADLLYHLLVALQARKVPLQAVADMLSGREGVSGVTEKASRPPGGV